MKLLNFFPGETRVIELLSAFTILTTALLFMYDSTLADMISTQTPRLFWFLALLFLGLMQLVSLVEFPKLELARCVSALLVGVFWLWFFLVHFDNDHSAGKFVYFFLSIGNFYAFLLSHRGLMKC